MRTICMLLCLAAAGLIPASVSAQNASEPAGALPSAPQPQPQHAATPNHQALKPCDVRNAAATMAATAAVRTNAAAEGQPVPEPPRIVAITLCVPYLPMINWYARFLSGPQVKPLTPLEKAQLAGRNLVDPFNLMTIVGEAGIAVGSNSHSAYGPGFKGFGRYVGVSFTQDMTGEFFGTFLIPSITHQDPHYHRMPGASVKRRIFHTFEQVVWTVGDNGKGMPNYSNLVGFAIENEISNLYVPGIQTDFPATAARYGTSLAIAPSDNLITEFLPDIARHIHVRVVLVQRIINQVARSEETAGSSP